MPPPPRCAAGGATRDAWPLFESAAICEYLDETIAPRLHDAVFGPVFRYFEPFERVADFGFFDETPKVRAWRAAGDPAVHEITRRDALP